MPVNGPAMLLARVWSGGMASTLCFGPSRSNVAHSAARKSSADRSVVDEPWAKYVVIKSLFQRIDNQPAEQLRIEIRALGRHPFARHADLADVVHGGGHHHGGQRILARLEPLDHFLDQMDVVRLGHVLHAQ